MHFRGLEEPKFRNKKYQNWFIICSFTVGEAKKKIKPASIMQLQLHQR
jgi:hypothetical protein